MRFAIILTFVCGALLFAGCADNSLMTDEEYTQSKGPAAHAPDFSGVLPQRSSTMNPGY
jgi:hypothetical protein